MTMLAAQGVHVELGGAPVLRGVSFDVGSDEMIAVVGPNGSGKSTLVRTLAGLLPPRAGRVELCGRPIGSFARRERARLLGLLVQNAEAPPLTSVREHVGFGRHAHGGMFFRDRLEDAEAVDRAMATCEVDGLASRRVDELSGGERQRVRLATLLAQNSRVLLLDEPLTGLDIQHQLALLSLLRALNRERERAIVCVMHDLSLALRFFPRLVVVHGGRVAADGAPVEVLCPGLLRNVFRVEGRVSCAHANDPVIIWNRPFCASSHACVATRPDAEVSVPLHQSSGQLTEGGSSSRLDPENRLLSASSDSYG